ncbi:MAG: BTAD domain-containing putative transcriptional regulator [Rhodothermales bacterium]
MIELRILGSPNLRRTAGEGAGAVHLQPKRLALLAYLALASPAGFCRRDKLLALFWPELNEEHARNALSQVVYQLRRALDNEAVISRGTEELRVSSKTCWCDAVAFENALEDDHLTEALDLYRGPLLDGLHVSEAPEFEHWLEIERERHCRRAGEAAAALSERDEAALRRLMTVLDSLGDRAGALHAYEAFARHLAQELDLSPSTETRKLTARLRTPTDALSVLDEGALPSVAVLPFANLSADPEQAYFCDGMTEEIINALAQIRGLRVAARTSVFAIQDQPFDVRTLAQKLGVDAVIEGSVRRVGKQLRITAQLIEAADGYHLWSVRYDRPLHDVFAIQDEIAQSVADAMRVELLQVPDRRQAPSPTEDMEAHALYLKGLFHRRKRTPENLKKACVCFQRAVERDPHYAQAHAALAFAYALGGWFLYDVFAPRHAYPLAREAAEKALSLNDRLAEAHLAIAYTCKAFEWDGPGAEQAFKQALTLDPTSIRSAIMRATSS